MIHNIRRSPQMSEPFEFDVAYSTSFDQIEKLRAMMLSFLKVERRDYQPIFDVYVIGTRVRSDECSPRIG